MVRLLHPRLHTMSVAPFQPRRESGSSAWVELIRFRGHPASGQPGREMRPSFTGFRTGPLARCRPREGIGYQDGLKRRLSRGHLPVCRAGRGRAVPGRVSFELRKATVHALTHSDGRGPAVRSCRRRQRCGPLRLRAGCSWKSRRWPTRRRSAIAHPVSVQSGFGCGEGCVTVVRDVGPPDPGVPSAGVCR